MPSSCAAFGCSNRSGTNLLSQLKFFRFPADPNRNKAWINAVSRENWKPSATTRICSAHFVSGQPSKQINHPDWVPSVFVHKKLNERKQQQKVSRFDRLRQRRNTSLKVESDGEPANECNVETINACTVEPLFKDSEIQAVPESCDTSVQTDDKFTDWEAMKTTIEQLQNDNNNMRRRLSDDTLGILKSQKLVKFYTGLESYSVFTVILNYVLSVWRPTCQILSSEAQLLIVLLKLRLGLVNQDLAYRFQVTPQIISTVFHNWIGILAKVLGLLVNWPQKRVIKRNLPKVFRKPKFSNTRCIIDCAEVFIQRPTNLLARAQTYSSYKNHNTVKFLLGVTPTGAISFISKAWGGRVSDKEITTSSGFLDLLECGDLILADRGFNIGELLALKGASLHIPPFTKGRSQLSRREVENARQLSRVRIHVERSIGRLKTFRILNSTHLSALLNENLIKNLLPLTKY